MGLRRENLLQLLKGRRPCQSRLGAAAGGGGRDGLGVEVCISQEKGAAKRWPLHGATWLPTWEALPPMPATSRAEGAWAPLPPVHGHPFLAAPTPASQLPRLSGRCTCSFPRFPLLRPHLLLLLILRRREAYWMPPLGPTDTRRAPSQLRLPLWLFSSLPAPPLPSMPSTGLGWHRDKWMMNSICCQI